MTLTKNLKLFHSLDLGKKCEKIMLGVFLDRKQEFLDYKIHRSYTVA